MIAFRHCRPAALPSKCSPFSLEYGIGLCSVSCHGQVRVHLGFHLFATAGASTESVTSEESQKNAVEAVGPVRRVFRMLDVKEVKQLRAFAHQQKKDIVIQHVRVLSFLIQDLSSI